MRNRMTRFVVIGSIGVLLLVGAYLAGAPVTATGTGSCDPFDVSCLRTANLYGADICTSTDTTCLLNYQSLGLGICAPGNSTCATTFASLIRTASPTAAVNTNALGTPIPTLPASTALALGTGIAATIPPGKYGVDLCAANDTNCLVAKQSLGIPICPPDDLTCRSTYAGIATPIRTYTPRDQTPFADKPESVAGGITRYVTGSDNDPNSAGVIHTYNK